MWSLGTSSVHVMRALKALITPECKRGSRSREIGTGAYFNF